MKNLKSILLLATVALLFSVIGCSYASAQTTQENYLKMKGKVLDGLTADITVFQLNDNDGWDKVRTMKSRKNYTLKLNPESNYYVLFESGDGLNKCLYVDAGSTGMWIMQLDINFHQKHIKYARMYQDPEAGYKFNVVRKNNTKIVIGRTSSSDGVNIPLSANVGK